MTPCLGPLAPQEALRSLGHDVQLVTGWQRLVFGRGQVICLGSPAWRGLPRYSGGVGCKQVAF